jgi:hypothetical protein
LSQNEPNTLQELLPIADGTDLHGIETGRQTEYSVASLWAYDSMPSSGGLQVSDLQLGPFWNASVFGFDHPFECDGSGLSR